MQSFRIQLQKYFPTFDELNEMAGQAAGQAAQIHFVSDVFVAVAVAVV